MINPQKQILEQRKRQIHLLSPLEHPHEEIRKRINLHSPLEHPQEEIRRMINPQKQNLLHSHSEHLERRRKTVNWPRLASLLEQQHLQEEIRKAINSDLDHQIKKQTQLHPHSPLVVFLVQTRNLIHQPLHSEESHSEETIIPLHSEATRKWIHSPLHSPPHSEAKSKKRRNQEQAIPYLGKRGAHRNKNTNMRPVMHCQTRRKTNKRLLGRVAAENKQQAIVQRNWRQKKIKKGTIRWLLRN